MKELLTTAEAAKLAGVGVSSIKRWADQALITVSVTPGGHRRIDRTSFEHFLELSSRVATSDFEPVPSSANGSNGSAQSQSGEGGAHRINLLIQRNDAPPQKSSFERMDPEAAGAFWADLILYSDMYLLHAALLETRSQLGSWYKTVDEVSLGLREVGLRWCREEIRVIDEHIATARLERSLNRISESLAENPSGPLCAVACVGSESHTLGLSLLQLCLREAGWRPVWIGGATPLKDILEIAEAGDVDMIALSASSASQDVEELDQITRVVGSACANSSTVFVTGGSGAWPEAPKFGTRFTSFTPFWDFLHAL